MDSSNQSSPQQTTTNTDTSNAAVASSSTPKTSDNTYTEPKVSDDEQFQRNTDHMGGWIKSSDLNHSETLAV
ncbi:hypothetical protein N7447_009186 [Penicillium robsamsonii]|uniref:uncharacterized protein n=1 Tax=Penicillium robsamsonii TaxID=1792511 RepID=UPI0025484414|nr:uncharacterized protein N7447_009186 [Penicillium robsamsonii]KAJ5816953.1 hypothetical protein N7447_009186 [Penicillium robsamsonii]